MGVGEWGYEWMGVSVEGCRVGVSQMAQSLAEIGRRHMIRIVERKPVLIFGFVGRKHTAQRMMCAQ